MDEQIASNTGPVQKTSSTLDVSSAMRDVLAFIQLPFSAVWKFLVKLLHRYRDFLIKHIFNNENKRKSLLWEQEFKEKMKRRKRALILQWIKIKNWFWNTFTKKNYRELKHLLSDLARIRKPMPGMLLASKKYQVTAEKIPLSGFVRVKFRWRKQTWKRHLGMSTDKNDPWQLTKHHFLINDFRLKPNGSLDLREVARCFMVDKLEVLSPGHLNPYDTGGSTFISGIGVHCLSQRDGFITVVERENALIRTRKLFHQWLRGSLIYCLLRWIVFLSIVGSILGTVGYLAYAIHFYYAGLVLPAVGIYYRFYALRMRQKYNSEWSVWPTRRARGWVDPKYKRYL